MFSISGLGKQLKSAAENFEQAGHALQARAAQQQQQTPGTPPSAQAKNKKVDAEPSQGRASVESPRTVAQNNALASRLSSLMAAKAAKANIGPQRTASTQSAGRMPVSTEHANNKAEQVDVDPVNIPLPLSPELQSINPPDTTTSPSLTTETSPVTHQPTLGASLFNTPRNLVNKIPAIKRVGTPTSATPSRNGDAMRERVQSEHDLFSLGPSGTDTPITGGAGDETPGHTLAATEALLAEVDEKTQSLSKDPATVMTLAAEQEEEGTGSQTAVDDAAMAEAVQQTQPVPVEDVSELSREELEDKYKTLCEKANRADQVLRSTSPLLVDGISDPDALDGWMKMTSGKAEMGTTEIKRLHDQLALQASRIEELRETHRMEQASSTTMIAALRDQVAQTESTLSTQATNALQVVQLRADLSTAQSQHKEADEKLTKAVTLLKTVRGKLVNVQKDREELSRALEDEKKERSRLAEALEKLRADKEREVQALRQAFENESQGLKDRFAKESLAEKRKWELEIITTKATHAKELASKSKHLNILTESIKELNVEKRRQFELLQSRQEEIETAVVGKEVSEAKLKEISLEANEAQERAALAEEALSEVKRELTLLRSTHQTSNETSGGNENAAALAEANAKTEGRLKLTKDEVIKLERERIDMEEEHAKQLRAQRAETERIRGILAEKNQEIENAIQSQRTSEDRLVALEREKEALRLNMQDMQATLRVAQESEARAMLDETSVKQETDMLRDEISRLTEEAEDAKQSVIQAKAANRNLREEMRRLQSSVQLLERQRNPGVGYWSAGGSQTPRAAEQNVDSRSSTELHRRTGKESQPPTPVAKDFASPAPSDVAQRNEEEEVNLEYLRNVILQFLENKEMRPNLVRVLSVILRFTPQELRRLNAKLSA